MQSAQTYLEIVTSRGERRLKLNRVYRNLRNRELFLLAYGKLYANKGSLTAGVDPNDTVDGMSLARIDSIIEALREGKYQWNPSRRRYIRKRNGKYRALGIAGWEDKLLQEVIRMVLTAYYEPQFSDASHGFRPGRGCHTALSTIQRKWVGTKWFIEGDISRCFDAIDHDKLLTIVAKSIEDERLIKLLRQMLQAGYMDDWQYHRTYSGTPQGNVLSPLLANIFLNELDQFITQELLPKYTRGGKRRNSPEYGHVQNLMKKAHRHGDRALYRSLGKQLREMSSKDTHDPNFRRLKYVRYADDFLLGFIGPKAEAEAIKQQVGQFLVAMGLTLSVEKTLITHAVQERARFLNYDIHIAYAGSRQYRRRRTTNGKVLLKVPHEVGRTWLSKYKRNGKPEARPELRYLSDYDIVQTYQLEFQGLVNYYKLANNVSWLHRVKGTFLESLVKTLATKHKKSARWVYRRYYRKLANGYKALVVTVPREGKQPLTATFSGRPIRRERNAVIRDKKVQLHGNRNELVRRLLADRCELCGATKNIVVHHIHRLNDLKRRYAGRSKPPLWVIRMMETRRKTLVVCRRCHQDIHNGLYEGARLK